MESHLLGDVPLATCAACLGVWLDRATFERLCAERDARAAVLSGPWDQAAVDKPALAAVRARVRYRRCPFCGKFMNRVNFARHSGFVLDVCRDHGTFFDQAELPGVVGFIARGGLDRARQREREALEEERRRRQTLDSVPRLGREAVYGDLMPESALDAILRDLFGRR
jgi:Zn-finger nucleic acid-binding protein